MQFKWREDEGYNEIVSELLEIEQVQSLQNFVHHKNVNRLNHVIQVSYKSYRIAKFFGLDYTSTARAGILHDLYFIQGHYNDGNHGHAYWHPKIAYGNAKQITHVNELERDIIENHMFGSVATVPKHIESWIVSIVDDIQALDDIITPAIFKIALKLSTKAPRLKTA